MKKKLNTEEYEKLLDEIRIEMLRMYYEKSPKCLTPDTMSRKMVIAPFWGAYGVQGYCLSVDGTPPRGTIFIFTEIFPNRFYFWNNNIFKDLGKSRLKHIRICEMLNRFVDNQEKHGLPRTPSE